LTSQIFGGAGPTPGAAVKRRELPLGAGADSELINAGRRLRFRDLPPAAGIANTCGSKFGARSLANTIRPFAPGNDAAAVAARVAATVSKALRVVALLQRTSAAYACFVRSA
jgi:hypothetical protein